MKKPMLSKPKFLSLNQEAKQEIIINIENNKLDDSGKQAAQECMLFAEKLEQHIQNKSITTFQQIKDLFEVHSLKKAQATQ